MKFHPKTSGAAVGFALGTVVVSVLSSIRAVHLSPEAYGAIPGALATLLSWLVPGPDPVPVPVPVPAPVSVVPPPAA